MLELQGEEVKTIISIHEYQDVVTTYDTNELFNRQKGRIKINLRRYHCL